MSIEYGPNLFERPDDLFWNLPRADPQEDLQDASRLVLPVQERAQEHRRKGWRRLLEI
jgi:hypothetical protein